MKCPICENEFQEYDGMRKDVHGKEWCKECLDMFDSIDPEEIYIRRHD